MLWLRSALVCYVYLYQYTQSTCLTCLLCLLHVLKLSMPTYVLSFSNIRSILSNRTYSILSQSLAIWQLRLSNFKINRSFMRFKEIIKKIAVCCSWIKLATLSLNKLAIPLTAGQKPIGFLWCLNSEKIITIVPKNLYGLLVYNHAFSGVMSINSQFCRVDHLDF